MSDIEAFARQLDETYTPALQAGSRVAAYRRSEYEDIDSGDQSYALDVLAEKIQAAVALLDRLTTNVGDALKD